jgi:hypothetical protein
MNFFPFGVHAPLNVLHFQPVPEGRKNILDVIALIALIVVWRRSHWQRSVGRLHRVTCGYVVTFRFQKVFRETDANCHRNCTSHAARRQKYTTSAAVSAPQLRTMVNFKEKDHGFAMRRWPIG